MTAKTPTLRWHKALSLSMSNEYRIIADGAGWVDRTTRGRLVVRGADAESFLHSLLSNDIVNVGVGDGTYSTYLTPQGRMLADLEVLRRPDGWFLSTAPGRAAVVCSRLDQSIFSEDVHVE